MEVFAVCGASSDDTADKLGEAGGLVKGFACGVSANEFEGVFEEFGMARRAGDG